MEHAVAMPRRVGLTATLRAYQELTKPGITIFVGLTAMAGYVVSAPAALDGALLIPLLCATICMSGGAAALNHVAERDLDALMSRTAGRPLPSGVLSARSAAAFGWMLSAVGAAIAMFTLPPLALVMLALCHASYVFWYTPMKRRSELCTLVGAIPGALPVLAGAAVATSRFSVPALALTGLLFVWQIPHFMAIGWLARDDYRRGGFVMLPVTDSDGRRTARVAFLYALATQAFAILMARDANLHPIVVAVVHTAGTAYVIATLPFLRKRQKLEARRLFFVSLFVLPVILAALVLNFALGL
jgi:heme o synthase